MSALFTGASGQFLNFFTGWALTQPWTLFARFKRTTTKNNASLMGFGKTAATYIAADDSASGTLGTQLYLNPGTVNPNGLLPQIPSNAWQSVCLTWNGSGAGTPTTEAWVGTTRIYSNPNTLLASSTDLFLGACGYSAFIGKAGYSYAWTSVLTDPQITAQVGQQAPITNTNLYAYWKLETDGTDSSGNMRDFSVGGTVNYDGSDNPSFGSPRASLLCAV